jgi:uncharacterized protein YyaL (SSP411 family)
MNEHFVSVKVDREERPDIDQIYMTAVQLISGGGGWPLNCFALPDGTPVYGGTYFTPDKWTELLNTLSNLYKSEPQKVIEYANNLKEGIIELSIVEQNKDIKSFREEDLEEHFSSWKNRFDLEEGGHKGAPKFPLPDTLHSLLLYFFHSKDPDIYNHVMLSLDKMAMGGINDHVGGGFARYSTDNLWRVPHFEKMLYDNGQLVSVYCQAYQLTKNEMFKRTAYETLRFIERELTSDEGGFYSALDADSEGIEGKYYVWDFSEISELLKKEANLISEYYNILPEGNWEQTNILYTDLRPEAFALKHNILVEDFVKNLERVNKILLDRRNSRIRPGMDDKILTSWNALMLKGYVDAFRVFGENRFLDTAVRNGSFIENFQLSEDYRLNRNFKDGKSTINGFLDDYALVIEAMTSLYEATFDEHWLFLSNQLMNHVIIHFYDQQSGMFYYTSDLDPPLVTRKMEIDDNVIPASNSSIAHGLFTLGKLLYNADYIQMAEQMLNNVIPRIAQNPAYHSNWLRLMTKFVYGSYEVAITGPKTMQVRQQFDEHFLPCTLFAGSMSGSNLTILNNRFMNGKTLIYVCKENVCKMPVENVKDALNLIV